MKKIALKEILSLSLDVAERMLKCGAEVSRVENTISIICKGYGVKYIEVFAMNSIIIATLRDDKDSVTESRRINYHKTDLLQLEKLNDLSRQICKKNISRKNVLEKIKKIKIKQLDLKLFVGDILAAFSFTLLFKGDLIDAFASSLIAILIFVFNEFSTNRKINNLINNFIISFMIGFISIILVKLGIGNNFDKIVIGDIMLLIPGLSMFISINDIFKGDIMSGIGRFTEGIFLALTIAAGVGLSLLMLGGII